MKKEMLINVLQPEECRIAILEDGVLEELYVERTSHESYVSNIYKGRIVNIEPSIQAAFVDFGVGRNGFLHVSDVEPAYYRHLEQGRGRGDRGDRGDRGRRGNGRGRDRDRDRDRDRGDEAARGRPADIEEEMPGLPEERPEPEQVQEQQVNEVSITEHAEEVIETLYEAPEETQETANEATAPDNPPLVALPETVPDEEPVRGRRRPRGGSRRRRGGEEAAESGQEPAGGAEPAEEANGPDTDEPPRPQVMDSAERRTTEKEPGERDLSAGGSGGVADDDLLFFPRPSTGRGPEPEPEREPEPESEPEPEPQAQVEEAEPVEVEEELPRRPPARPRPEFGGNIEDELEADLAAADISEDLTPEFEATFDTHFEAEPDFEQQPLPPREGRRGERGERDRGRGERGGRSERGERGERRGRRDRDDRRGGGRRMGGRPGAGRPKPLIQDIFRRGQEVLVQVIKDGLGTKGPTLSTYISIAGRYLVLMPGLNRTGVSRKIADEEQRRRLREMFNELKPPRGLGFIMRTAAIDKNKKELQRDLSYLSRLWQVVVKRIRKLKSPAEIYQESDMITRTIRDTFTNDIDTIWVDEPAAYEAAQEFMSYVMPRYANRIKLYDGKEPLFHKYGIEDEIVKIQQKKVPLPHGGSIVIEQTEALVAIDVNSGNFRADNNAEETAYQMNLQAAREIARQLRLRDLGGVIVNDFIDMRDEKHRRAVEKAMRDAVKRDRARTKVLKISAFGLIEMTRQRIRPSLKRSVYQDCPYCHGMAQVKTVESMSIEVMRMLQLAAHRENVTRIEIHVTEEVANYLLNKKRRDIARLEESGNIQVQVIGKPGLPPESLEFVCYDNNNNEVKFLPSEDNHRSRR
jgi:ribonuclease E